MNCRSCTMLAKFVASAAILLLFSLSSAAARPFSEAEHLEALNEKVLERDYNLNLTNGIPLPPPGWNVGGQGYVQMQFALTFNVTSFYPSNGPIVPGLGPAMNLGYAYSQSMVTFVTPEGPQFAMNTALWGSPHPVVYHSLLTCACGGEPYPYVEKGVISFTPADNLTFVTLGVGGNFRKPPTSGFMAAAKFNITGGTGKFENSQGVMASVGWTTFNPISFPIGVWASWYTPKGNLPTIPGAPQNPGDAPPVWPPPFNGM